MKVQFLRIGILVAVIAICCAACAPDEETEPCSVPAGDCYAPGMEIAGQHFVVRLVESEPGPPVRGDTNVWTLSITDLDGEAAIDVDLRVEPTMPAHGHGTTPVPTVAPVEGQPGTFDIRPLNLFMPGLWQIRIVLSMEVDGAVLEDAVDFEFWIES